MPRIFYAVDLPDDVVSELKKLQELLSSGDLPVRWVSGQNFHLTLLFLGEISRRELDKHVGIIRETGFSVRPFTTQIGGVGVFPGCGNPRVIWSGLKKGREQTGTLAGELARVLGIHQQKPFSPHITLGRVKTGQNAVIQPEKWSDFLTPEFRVESFHCMESTLTPRGPVYKTVASFALKNLK